MQSQSKHNSRGFCGTWKTDSNIFRIVQRCRDSQILLNNSKVPYWFQDVFSQRTVIIDGPKTDIHMDSRYEMQVVLVTSGESRNVFFKCLLYKGFFWVTASDQQSLGWISQHNILWLKEKALLDKWKIT